MSCPGNGRHTDPVQFRIGQLLGPADTACGRRHRVSWLIVGLLLFIGGAFLAYLPGGKP